MSVFKCSQCGGQMYPISWCEYQCENCGDIADYSELVKGVRNIFTKRFK